MKAPAQIFLSYAREDKEKVENLYQKLSDAGFKPWMDKKDILPGEVWKSSIRRAIQCSDFFLACLSANSVSKRGFLQKEIKDALDIWQEKLEDDIYLIPVRLEDCRVLDSLRKFQWVNLFEEDGWTRLVKAIRVGMERLDMARPLAERQRRQREALQRGKDLFHAGEYEKARHELAQAQALGADMDDYLNAARAGALLKSAQRSKERDLQGMFSEANHVE